MLLGMLPLIPSIDPPMVLAEDYPDDEMPPGPPILMKQSAVYLGSSATLAGFA
jgi:hypothetical protein